MPIAERPYSRCTCTRTLDFVLANHASEQLLAYNACTFALVLMQRKGGAPQGTYAGLCTVPSRSPLCLLANFNQAFEAW
jgi:hypothetical protein